MTGRKDARSMNKVDGFLSLYKDYESLVRATGMEPKDLEDELDARGLLDGGRLRCCRQLRNYLSHVNDPGFVAPSDKMMAFLDAKVRYMKELGDVAKNHLKKPAACMCKDTDKCGTAEALFQKLKCLRLPVIHGDGMYSWVGVFDFVGSKGTWKVGSLKQHNDISFCGPLDDYHGLDSDRVVLCTDDGTSTGKLLGRVWFPGTFM